MVFLESWADVWGPVMLTIIWQAGLLALVALGCEWVLRVRAARVRHRLWWLVLAAPLALAPARMALEQRSATVALPAPTPMVRSAGFTQLLVRLAEPLALWEEGQRSARGATPVTPPRTFELSASAALLAGWMLGCAVVAGRLLLGHRSLRRLLAASQPVSDSRARETLEALCREAGVRREIALRSTADLSAPLLYGLRRPTILMPREWLDSLSPEDLRVVLAHEVAHIKRGDVLGNLLQRMAELPLFFHPAVWLAGRRIMLAREELCDTVALGDGADARGYALSLLSVAEKTRGRLALASVGVAEGRFTLLRRVEAIMAGDIGRRFSRTAGAVLGLLLLTTAVAVTAIEVRSAAGAGEVRSSGGGAWGQGPQGDVLQGDTLAEADQVVSNMRNIALALLMFAFDHDDTLPNTSDSAELMEILREYVKGPGVFMRPGTDDEAVVKFTFQPGFARSSVADPGKSVVAVVDYAPGWRVEAYLDGSALLVLGDGSTPTTPSALRSARGELEAGSPLVLPLLNLWRYGPDPLVAGTSWTYDFAGDPLAMRIIEAGPNGDGTATVLMVDLSWRSHTERARVVLPLDRRSLSVSTGSGPSFRTFDLAIPLLRPGATWKPLGEEEGTVTSTEQLPLTTAAGHFPDAAKVAVSFGEPLGEATFWFAPGVGLVAVEETHGRHTTKGVELTEYRPAGTGYEDAAAQDLPPGMGSEDQSIIARSMLLNLSPYGPSELQTGASWSYDVEELPVECRLQVVEVTQMSQTTGLLVTADLSVFGTTKRVQVTLSADRRLLHVRPAPPALGATVTLTLPKLNAGDRWLALGLEEVDVYSVESRPLSTPEGEFADSVRIALGNTQDDAALWFVPGVGLAAVEDSGRRFVWLTKYRPGGGEN